MFFEERTDIRSTPYSFISSGLDMFSAWIRKFSYNLTVLHLTAPSLSAELFWPQTDENSAEIPNWPTLRDLIINTSLECMWYTSIGTGLIHCADLFGRRSRPLRASRS